MSTKLPSRSSHRSTRASSRSRLRRVVAAAVGGVLVAAGAGVVGVSASPSTPACGPTPTDPIADYGDWNVVTFGDMHVGADSEGSLAVGGTLSFGSEGGVGVATYPRDVAHLTRAELAEGAQEADIAETGPEEDAETSPVGLVAHAVDLGGSGSRHPSSSTLDVMGGDVFIGG